ncbi:MAG: hypothetical protein MIO90_04880 [Methanomassiliicoccales archaeon]|nr:hypothetical protein [Methanomassiliicoccales archaeon]
MMEFFLSKIWAFVVGVALLGVLLQGVTMQAQAERSSVLQDMAENVQELFRSVKGAGPGLERTIWLKEILPTSVELTVHNAYATLEGEGEVHAFAISLHLLLLKGPSGQLEEVDSIALDAEDVIMLVTGDEGLTMIVLNPRTCPPGT